MTTPLRVAVTGGNGVLGRALRAVRPDWMYLNRAECNVCNVGTAWHTFKGLHPDVVVHAAALTDHQHPNAAEVIETNICGTQIVAAICEILHIPLVYTSTHYVYEGTRGNYSETDAPHPIGAYAWSKLAGENAVLSLLDEDNYLIVRGSWYTRETRLDHWAKRGALTDAWCSREPVMQSAHKIIALIEAGVRGVVNIGGPRRTFMEILHDEGYMDFPRITRADIDDMTRDLALPYAFPADVSVNTEKFDALGLTLP